MRWYKTAVLTLALIGQFGAVGRAQSLGDAARLQRQKKSPKATAATPKVITNDDIGASSPDSRNPATPSSKSGEQASAPEDSKVLPKPSASTDPGPYEEWVKAGKEWQARIVAQKAKIQSMQSYVDKLRSSVHFAAKNPNYDAAIINAHELQKVDEAKRLEKQLVDESATLQNMQEALRSAGYDSSIYNPPNPQQDTGNPMVPAGSPQD